MGRFLLLDLFLFDRLYLCGGSPLQQGNRKERLEWLDPGDSYFVAFGLPGNGKGVFRGVGKEPAIQSGVLGLSGSSQHKHLVRDCLLPIFGLEIAELSQLNLRLLPGGGIAFLYSPSNDNPVGWLLGHPLGLGRWSQVSDYLRHFLLVDHGNL